MINTKKRYHALDSIRGILALIVMFSHYTGYIDPEHSVLVFFILSGFVLSHSYAGKNVTYIEFINKRFSRMYPTHIFFILFYIIVYIGYLSFISNDLNIGTKISNPVNIEDKFNSLIYYIFSIQGVIDFSNSFYRWNPPSWSIGIELYLNVILFSLIVRYNKNKLLVILALLISLYVINLYIPFKVEIYKHSNFTSYINFYNIFYGMIFMILGILLYNNYNKIYICKFINKYIEFLIVFVWLFVSILYINVNTLLFNIMISLPLILIFANCKTPIALFLQNCKYTKFLGEISFLIYIAHTPISNLIGYIYKIFGISSFYNTYYNKVLMMIIVIICSHFITKYFTNKLYYKLTGK